MYAAIFCARLVFDIGERKRWITHLTMIKLMTETKFNFMNMWQATTVASLVVIFAGIAGAVIPGVSVGQGAIAGAILGGVLGATVRGRQYYRDTRGYCYYVDQYGNPHYSYDIRC